jgi:YidC/Oxa1 family membrane protein insertase
MIRCLRPQKRSKALERRLVLFFILVALIMWFSQKLMPRRTPPAHSRYEVSEADSTSIQPEESGQRDTVAWAPSPEPAEELMRKNETVAKLFKDLVPAKDETVHVETDDLELTVVSRGGTVSECLLPDFLLKDDGAVSLFPENYDGILGVILKKGGEEHDLRDLPYDLDVKRGPEAGIAARVSWTVRGTGGVRLRKELEVPEHGYSCRFKIEARGLGIAG